MYLSKLLANEIVINISGALRQFVWWYYQNHDPVGIFGKGNFYELLDSKL